MSLLSTNAIVTMCFGEYVGMGRECGKVGGLKCICWWLERCVRGSVLSS